MLPHGRLDANHQRFGKSPPALPARPVSSHVDCSPAETLFERSLGPFAASRNLPINHVGHSQLFRAHHLGFASHLPTFRPRKNFANLPIANFRRQIEDQRRPSMSPALMAISASDAPCGRIRVLGPFPSPRFFVGALPKDLRPEKTAFPAALDDGWIVSIPHERCSPANATGAPTAYLARRLSNLSQISYKPLIASPALLPKCSLLSASAAQDVLPGYPTD